jgi:predicted RNA binding protein YcfA (HicA-like mRNA interferase family)
VSRFPKLSGIEIVKILTKRFGFRTIRQTGSHAVLSKFVNNKKIVTIVPLHKEVKTGTIFGILSLTHIEKEEFLNKL